MLAVLVCVFLLFFASDLSWRIITQREKTKNNRWTNRVLSVNQVETIKDDNSTARLGIFLLKLTHLLAMPFVDQRNSTMTRSVTKIRKIWNSRLFQRNESSVTNCKSDNLQKGNQCNQWKFKQVNRWPTGQSNHFWWKWIICLVSNFFFLVFSSKKLISMPSLGIDFGFFFLFLFECVLTMLHVTFDWFGMVSFGFRRKTCKQHCCHSINC